jgi:transcriptional regulator with XRE-family HTH domain
MPETLLHDDVQTVARLDSIACLLEWMRSMPASGRKRFCDALADRTDTVQQVVVMLLKMVKDPRTTPAERHRALVTINDALFLDPDEEEGEYGQDLAASETNAAAKTPWLAREVQKMNGQEAKFAERLRQQMEAKRISQQELADRVGCSQPAISQMLNRMCRPQKKTILKLAEALNVQARELWPDIDVADMLDAVASFQQDDYVMTDAEARSLAEKTSRKNRPKVRAKSLPTRR